MFAVVCCIHDDMHDDYNNAYETSCNMKQMEDKLKTRLAHFEQDVADLDQITALNNDDDDYDSDAGRAI